MATHCSSWSSIGCCEASYPALVIAIPIIFQPELRRFLEQVGRQGTHPLARYIPISEGVSRASEVVAHAAGRLSQNRWGGLIVIERETGLEDFVETGHRIDGQVSEDLLLTIFYPNSRCMTRP